MQMHSLLFIIFLLECAFGMRLQPRKRRRVISLEHQILPDEILLKLGLLDGLKMLKIVMMPNRSIYFKSIHAAYSHLLTVREAEDDVVKRLFPLALS